MTVDVTRNDLDRFRYSCPAWWRAFERGRRAERERAIGQCADWQDGDFQRAAAWKITEGVD